MLLENLKAHSSDPRNTVKVFIESNYLFESQSAHQYRMMRIGKRNMKTYVQIENFPHATLPRQHYP